MKISKTIKDFLENKDFIVDENDTCSEFGECVTLSHKDDKYLKYVLAYIDNNEMKYWVNFGHHPAIMCKEHEWFKYITMRAFW